MHISKLTVVVGADLQSLVSSHNQSCLSILLVLQESNITGTTLLPLVGLANKLEELCAHLECLLLELLVGLNLNFLGQANDWLEVNILGLGSFILSAKVLESSLYDLSRLNVPLDSPRPPSPSEPLQIQSSHHDPHPLPSPSLARHRT